MATPNVGILTNSGKNLIDQVNAGKTKITFSKIVFSSMDNSKLTDDQVKALTVITPQEVVVNSPEATLDANTGETRIRATGNNEALTDGVYVKTYAVYAKDDSDNEILYGITVSPNPNYFPEYDGITPQAVTYSYKVNISNTSNITFTNSNDIYVSDTDLTEAIQPYAKTVDVNQQLNTKVNVSDMRKPASDVAGIEEVSALQTQVNNSAVGTNLIANSNFSSGLNHWSVNQGTNSDCKAVVTTDSDGNTCIHITGTGNSCGLYCTPVSFNQNQVTTGSVLVKGTGAIDIVGLEYRPVANFGTISTEDYSKVGSTMQSASSKNNFVIYLDAVNGVVDVYVKFAKLELGYHATNWCPAWEDKADDSAVVHNTGNEEIADQKTFDVAPIDKTTGNPYITKDGVPAVPSTLADTTKPANFTAGLQSGGVDVATAADIKSLEASAWRPIISNNYSGLCMMKYNADTETMSLSGTIFPKTYSTEGSRVAVIIPMPEGFSMGENTDSKTTIWTNATGSVQKFAGIVADLKYESDGIHIIFDKIYSNYPDPKMFIILDDFFAYSTANPQSNNLINFKVTKN